MTDVIEAPAAVKPVNHWIGGKRYEGRSGRSGAVYNPATGQQTGAVDFATAEEVDQAVQAARQAFPAWRALSPAKRADLFFPIPALAPDKPRPPAKIPTPQAGKGLPAATGDGTRGPAGV